MSQPTVELARRFPFDSYALAEEFDSTLKLSDSGRRFLESAHELQQIFRAGERDDGPDAREVAFRLACEQLSRIYEEACQERIVLPIEYRTW